jgi:hypothetical protein
MLHCLGNVRFRRNGRHAGVDYAMTDLDAHAQRVTYIATANHGQVLGRVGDVVTLEIPADVSIGLAAVWGQAGFVPIFVGKRTRLSHCRVIDMNGHTIVRHQMVTTAFYRYTVDLSIDTRTGGNPPAAAVAVITVPPR